jgi:hypothetical protein
LIIREAVFEPCSKMKRIVQGKPMRIQLYKLAFLLTNPAGEFDKLP